MVGGDAVSQYGDDGSIAQLQTLCTQCAAHPPSPSIFSQYEIKWSQLTSTKPKYWNNSDVTKTPKEPTKCSWGNLVPRFWRASSVLGALLKRKKIIQKCLAEPLTFFGANCCRKLSIAACLRLGCSAVVAHYLRIFATTLQYFCNFTSVFLQFHLHFCNIFHLHWGSTELIWCNKHYVTKMGPQLTSFGEKNVTWQIPGTNQPP